MFRRSVFEPLVQTSQEINSGETNEQGRIFTIPTVLMTLPRPVLALKTAEMLRNGARPVTPMVALTFATDMEGAPGRFIDKLLPNSKLGTSSFGAKSDIIADTAALLIIGGAALTSPRMPVVSKAAVATTLGHEGFKSIWGLNKNRQWRDAGGDGNLYIKPSLNGKCSMAEKMTALGLAVLSSDFDDQRLRQPIAAAALAFSAIGTARGEHERRDYEGVASNMINELKHTLQDTGIVS